MPTAPDRKALAFILVTAFLNLMGVGLIGPVVPFLVQPYARTPGELAVAVGALGSSYAICQFLAAPGLGALSDRYGRRPILLVCLLGSAAGYVLFGLGGALWVLFLGRIIDGLTGGNISTMMAYVSDITAPEERSKYFGMIGAAAGLGFMLGPAIGGVTAKLGYAAPAFFAAAIALANGVWGYLNLPESLSRAQRAEQITASQLNPLRQLSRALAIPPLRWLLLTTFLFAFPFAALQATAPVLAKDSLRWDADAIGALYFTVGVVDIVVQGGLLRWLLPRFGAAALALVGLACMGAGYLLIGTVAGLASALPLVAGTIVVVLGEGLVGPALGGLISQTVAARDQGRVQGGNQAVQALARVVGPVWGGALYARWGGAAPYWSGAVVAGVAVVVTWLARPPGKAQA
jgi:DHA1 family tetracycline resistance protein-like MFS transporter